MNDILPIFREGFFGVFQIFLIIVAAGALVRLKFVTSEHVKGLAVATVACFLPCLMFSNITTSFDPGKMAYWWTMPLAGIAMALFGIGVASLIFIGDWHNKRNMVALAGLQNAGYLILPIGQALFPDKFDSEFSIYCFLFITGYSPLLWTLGKFLTTSSPEDKLEWKGLITPPFVGTLFALALVFLGVQHSIPKLVGHSINLLGQAAVPVATFVLGAALGGMPFRFHHHWVDITKALSIKLMILPFITLLILHALKLQGTMGGLLILEGASAPATALILQVKRYGGDEEKVGAGVLAATVVGTLTMPLWYALWKVWT